MKGKVIQIHQNKVIPTNSNPRPSWLRRFVPNKIPPAGPRLVDKDEIHRLWLMESQRRVRARTRNKMLLVMCLVLGITAVMIYRLPSPAGKQKPALQWRSSGLVQYVRPHGSARAVTTLVATTVATYQVSGTVLAARGDSANVKMLNYADRVERYLCIESAISADCYPML